MTVHSSSRSGSDPRPQNPEPVAAPLARTILHQTVVDHLRDMIIEGALAAGSRINERELCETLGISRTPLREALKVLAAEGLIDIMPNRGASVAKLSREDVLDMFELMGGLEALSGQLACERITDDELAQLHELHADMVGTRQRRDLSAYYSRNRQIHDLINQAARNEALRQVYIATNRRLDALRFRSNFDVQKWDLAIREHETMLDALDARDGDRLAAIMQHHLKNKRDAVIDGLDNDNPPPARKAKPAKPGG